MRVLVVGLALTGNTLAKYFAGRGDEVTVIEDSPSSDDAWRARLARATAAGVRVIEQPDAASVAALVGAVDLVVPSPGVPEGHAALVAALSRGVPVRSEVDIAADGARPALIAVTGTNGKTTVTTLTTAMLEASGRRVMAAGNIGTPLLDAVHADIDVIVAEVSSFQLAFTTAAFSPRAAALLNLGADHLDWHRTFDAYARAKANVFSHQQPGDALVFNADDPVVSGLASDAPGRRIPFSVANGAATGYRVVETATGRLLVGADDEELVPVDLLPRRSAIDLANALAAAALAVELGATVDAVRSTLVSFTGLDHRLQLVAEHNGVRYLDDSKATNVHATLAAVQDLSDVVLIAGGRNKELDLGELRVLAPRLRAVIAIGESAAEVADAFAGVTPVVIANSMRDAVRAAAEHAETGDTVLLSPACASFDWYRSYAARGDDFAREVQGLTEVQR
jgi:UDP-N-acetylmuramoylalanine--D-glutamate ligase